MKKPILTDTHECQIKVIQNREYTSEMARCRRVTVSRRAQTDPEFSQ